MCYRDYGNTPQLEVEDFVEKEGFQALQTTLNRLEAAGGDDAAEDIAGALDVCLLCFSLVLISRPRQLQHLFMTSPKLSVCPPASSFH